MDCLLYPVSLLSLLLHLFACCCQAILNIISNPVNSTVPIAAECLKAMGVYDKRKVMGVTTLDVVSVLALLPELVVIAFLAWTFPKVRRC